MCMSLKVESLLAFGKSTNNTLSRTRKLETESSKVFSFSTTVRFWLHGVVVQGNYHVYSICQFFPTSVLYNLFEPKQ